MRRAVLSVVFLALLGSGAGFAATPDHADDATSAPRACSTSTPAAS